MLRIATAQETIVVFFLYLRQRGFVFTKVNRKTQNRVCRPYSRAGAR